VTTYRDDTASVRAENARLRAELATADATAHRRYAMRPGDRLAAPIIIGGYPMGVLLMVACIRLALPLWAAGAALALGAVWWLLALRWMHEGDR
jgi:hypothetical protein